MSEKKTIELARPKSLPFSTAILDRVLKQSKIGMPEISESEFIENKETSALKTDFYTNEEIFASEMKLFQERAAVVGFNDQVLSPGDHFVCTIRDQNLLVLRDEENTLHAYYNSCIHRGTRLVSEKREKTLKKIVCPYHSWTYDLDGQLLTANCKVPEKKLVELPILNSAGMLFVGFQNDALKRLEPVLTELNDFKFDSYVPYAVKKTIEEFNWKVGVEIFLESYHISTVHKNSVAPVIAKNASIFDPIEEHSRILMPNRSFEHTSVPTRKDLIISYFLFPSTILIIFRDHFAMLHFQPISAEKCVCTQAVMIPQKAQTQRMIRHWDYNADFFFKTISEDLHLAGEIQLGLKRSGFIFPSSYEPGILHFHKGLKEFLKSQA
ncbi:aromatic ring-hydroxylating dioxygenase subunit alpha [Leptospira sp. WS92.C1]